MAKQRVSRWGGKLVVIVGTILGIVVGKFLSIELDKNFPNRIFGNFSGGDAIVMILGVALMFFGGRVHRIVKYMGLGMVVVKLGDEVYQLIATAK